MSSLLQVLPIPPSAKRTFHIVQVASVRIEAVLYDCDPMIEQIYPALRPPRRTGGQICLGPAVIPVPDDGKSWQVCKYGPSEPCIHLTGLRKNEVEVIAFEFGIPVGHSEGHPTRFFTSPAWLALCRWTHQHPRLAQRLISVSGGNSAYLGNRPARAMALPGVDERLSQNPG